MKQAFWFVICALLAAGSARGADMSAPSVPPLPNPALRLPTLYDWTGFYLGINGGGAWGNSQQSQSLPPMPLASSFDVSGGVIGGTAGFKLQVDRAVFGLEADMDWAHISGSATCHSPLFTCATQSDYLATARGLLGYALPDHWLPYVTGGAALGNIEQSFSPPVGVNSGTISNRVGWTAGAGIEFAFWDPWSSHWSVKLEYLYVDLGTFNCTIACSGVAGQVTSMTLKENIVRTGIDYRF